jgi:hypothetical protein
MTNVNGLSFLHKNIWSTTYVSVFFLVLTQV